MEEELKNKLVSLDSNIFVYYFESNPEFGICVKEIFLLLEKNKLKAVTSVTTLIELLSRKELDDHQLDLLRERFSTVPNLQTFDINEELALEAARIRREYKFKMPDAIQLATAINQKAQAFITNDDGLKKFKEIKVLLLSEVKLRGD